MAPHAQIPSAQIAWKQEKFPIHVVAENIHSPSNQGLIIRICESFGVEKIFFTGPYSNNKSQNFHKAARAAEKYISIESNDDTTSVIQSLITQQFKIYALEICNTSQQLDSTIFNPSEKLALIIGSERHGINVITLTQVETALHIQQFGKTGSINVGTALSIALYEITKQIS